jgi:hypothetical protein
VAPDGVLLTLRWDAFEVGMSLFIPAIDLRKLNKQVQKIASEKGWKLEGRERIETGRLGMRFWRLM